MCPIFFRIIFQNSFYLITMLYSTKKYYQLARQKFGAAYPSQKPRSSTGRIGLFDIHVDLVWDKDMQEHLPQVLELQRFQIMAT
jgi:hypothetical protein